MSLGDSSGQAESGSVIEYLLLLPEHLCTNRSLNLELHGLSEGGITTSKSTFL